MASHGALRTSFENSHEGRVGLERAVRSSRRTFPEARPEPPISARKDDTETKVSSVRSVLTFHRVLEHKIVRLMSDMDDLKKVNGILSYKVKLNFNVILQFCVAVVPR